MPRLRESNVIHTAETKKMIIDLAHASPQLIADVYAIATRPLLVSHTGVCGTCDTTRNLSEHSIKRVAASGGLIGIAMFDMAICGATIAAAAQTMRYVVDLVVMWHLALILMARLKHPFMSAGLPLITVALLAVGFTVEDVAKMMGGNALRFLQENLKG